MSLSVGASNPGNVRPIPVTAAFDEECFGLSAGSLVVSGASVETFSAGSLEATFLLEPIGQQASTSVELPQGACMDAAGNPNAPAQIVIEYGMLDAACSVCGC